MHLNDIPTNYTSCFRGKPPTLCYTWRKKIREDFSPPRILHSHEDIIELLLITAGSASYTLDGRKYAVEEGDIIVINAGVMHDEDARLTANTSALLIGLKEVRVVGEPDGKLIPAEAYPILTLGEQFPFIQSIMQTIHDLSDLDAVQYTETCQFLAVGMVCMLLRLFQQRGFQQQTESKNEILAQRIQRYIDTHYQEDFTLQDVGEAVHINPYYVSHIFKESAGYSPMQYAIRLRIGQAQALLAATNYTITQIAGMVGYDNPSHFNTMFTKYIGMSPSKYRKIFLPPQDEK